MAKHCLLVGTTSWIDYVRITDMNGSPITGLTNSSTGLLSKYVLSGAASVAISIISQTVTGAYSSGGFVEIDATAFPGLYRFDIPNAALASGNKSYVSLYGYSGMNVSMLEYDLVAYNPQDAVRLGLTALPNATAGATNGLPLSVDSSGRVDVLKINGTSQTARDIGASVLLSSGSGTGQILLSSGAVTAGTVSDKTGYALSGTQAFNVTGNITGNLSGSVGSVTGAVGSVTGAVGSVTGNVSGSVASVVGAVGSVTGLNASLIDVATSTRTKPADTQAAVTLVATTTNLTNAPGAGDFTAAMKTSLNAATPASVVGAVGSVTGSVGSVVAGVSLTAGQLAIKQNTALANFEFPMTDSTTNVPKTGLTVTATRSIDGAAFAACANAVSAVSNGIYKINLAASDLNGTVITLRFTAALANDRLITIIPQA